MFSLPKNVKLRTSAEWCVEEVNKAQIRPAESTGNEQRRERGNHRASCQLSASLECCHVKPLESVCGRGFAQHPRITYCKENCPEPNRHL